MLCTPKLPYRDSLLQENQALLTLVPKWPELELVSGTVAAIHSSTKHVLCAVWCSHHLCLAAAHCHHPKRKP